MNRDLAPHTLGPTLLENGRLGCVIVHHRNIEELPTTVDLIRSQGISSDLILVVDNSETHVPDVAFEGITQSGVNLLRIKNRGYGDAANHGIEALLAKAIPPEFVLIATHEVKPEEGVVQKLVFGLETEPQRMIIGPMLISKLPDGGIRQSFGGYRTALGIPMHAETCGRPGSLSSEPIPPEILDRDWLDGAFVMYRSSFLREQRFRKEFFLYFEETDLHFRLNAYPGSIGCIPSAVVNEVESGIPPYLRSRNLQWFIQLHGSWWQRFVTVPWVLTKIFAKVVLGKARFAAFRLGVLGWLSACRHPIAR